MFMHMVTHIWCVLTRSSWEKAYQEYRKDRLRCEINSHV